jgi:hypothetical protein
VRPEIGEDVTSRSARRDADAAGHARVLLQFDRCAEPRDPDVGGVGEPVVVADERVAATAPAAPPRVLDPEAVAVVADDRERVATGDRRLRSVLDHAVAADLFPAVVHGRGDVEDPNLADRRMHRDQILVIHAQVGAERTARRVAIPFAIGNPPLDVGGPAAQCARAVLLPPFHRAAGTRAFVVLAGPFVVAARHVVEHPRAHFAAVGHHLPRAKQIVNDGGETESRARAFASLVEDRNTDFGVRRERSLG